MHDLSINTSSQTPVIENNTPQNSPSGEAPPFDSSKDQKDTMVSASDLNLLQKQAPELYKSLYKSTVDWCIRQGNKQREKSHQKYKEENGI